MTGARRDLLECVEGPDEQRLVGLPSGWPPLLGEVAGVLLLDLGAGEPLELAGMALA